MPNNLVISVKSILTFFGVLLVGWMLYQVREVLLVVYISLIFTLMLAPLVGKLEKKIKRRSVAVFIVVILSVIVFGALVSLCLKAAVDQSISFIATFPSLLQDLLSRYDQDGGFGNQLLLSITQSLAGNGSGGLVNITKGIFSNALSVFSIIIFTFYFLVDFDKLRDALLSFFAGNVKKKVEASIKEVEAQLGSWMRGQLFLMLIIGVMSFIGLTLLGVKYALPLAFLAGLLEVIPNIGPVVSAIPAVLVAWVVSPWLAIGTVALYVLIQQLENTLIVPKVMQKALGFNPLTTILAILIGGRLLGLVGAILALPTLLWILVVLRQVTGRKIDI